MAKQTGFEMLVAAARVLHLEEEPLLPEDAGLAGRPCAHHCSVCNGAGELHHWIDECADEGDPLQVCKHCSAWRAYPDDDVED